MTSPELGRLYAAIDATWPAAETRQCGAFRLRRGKGGGQRVSAATCEGAWAEPDIDAAETGMQAFGQTPIFMLRAGENALDAALQERGYAIKDPVTLLLCRADTLLDMPIPPVTAFAIWEPLAVMEEIWAEGGIDADRLAVMARAKGPKTAIFGRVKDMPAGTAFVALSGDIAMIHAVEVLSPYRRHGLAQWMMRKAAFWAADQGAAWLSVLCTDANHGAKALYASLGFVPVGQYHYRVAPGGGTT